MVRYIYNGKHGGVDYFDILANWEQRSWGMNDGIIDDDKIELLLNVLVDDQISERQAEELCHLLRDNPDAQKRFVRFITEHTLLMRHFLTLRESETPGP